jgi:PAS domain S-box-containing protein
MRPRTGRQAAPPRPAECRDAVGPHLATALAEAADDSASVLLVGLEAVDDRCWDVLAEAGVHVERVLDIADAMHALELRPVHVVLGDARDGSKLIPALRAREELASTHVILCAPLDADDELREALGAGADDVMRIPFEPEVLAARVAAGLRAGRLRANDGLLRSLVANVPGAVYRCACDADWTMEWLSDGIVEITGHAASDFIHSAVRTYTSVIHPDDREHVQESIAEAVHAGRPFTLEYRVQHRDGTVRWVLERGRLQQAPDGRRWLDGAIFDITMRRAAEEALREREIVEAQLTEVRASRARIVAAADGARREIERNLHDGAQQRFVSTALRLQLWLATDRELAPERRSELSGVLDELRAGLAELRDLARGLHPAVLSDRGLAHALSDLAHGASVPVELRTELPAERLPMPIEAAAYFTVCEGLTNIIRYAGAATAWISVSHGNGELTVEVGDDGIGGAAVDGGSGLQGLRDRVAAVGGTLDIQSPPGGGTVVRARLPVMERRLDVGRAEHDRS